MVEEPAAPAVGRRDELLELAAAMFAERGLRATTVRDIADLAGILSGSLYHHFSSKEEMVDEVSRIPRLAFERYEQIAAIEPNPLERLKGLFMTSFEAIEDRHAQVVIIRTRPSDSLARSGSPTWRNAIKSSARCGWICSTRASRGVLPARYRRRSGLSVHSRHHLGFVRWYQPGGPLTAEEVGRQYLAIVLGGITKEQKV